MNAEFATERASGAQLESFSPLAFSRGPPREAAGRPRGAVLRGRLPGLALGQVREATSDLAQALRLGDEEFLAPAEWYLALIHLRGKDSAEARPHLQRITRAGGFYQGKARALLAEPDRLHPGK